MFNILKCLGCGTVILVAIASMYCVAQSVIGTAVVTATIGLRQGSPTSCLLFILYVNDLIMMIKKRCGVDGLLSWLHVLVLMDNTVLLSTTYASIKQAVYSHGIL